ncbi:MAG TPA: hypothetical protein VGP87_04030 [Gemmatimonadales bacterium]|jgi:hypothetical protein|nr:hypothetical protein [Gemmatimonadales bacterium]
MPRLCWSLPVIVGAAALMAGCSHSPPQTMAATDPGIAQDLERVRNATRIYQDTAVARAAGYPTMNASQCLADSTEGGMGQHFVNRALLSDTLSLEHPQILLYAHDAKGKMKLVAVEYIIPYRIHPREADPPRIFGRPLRQNDPLKLWNLHVWAFEKNPSGLFAEWNPAVKCPAHAGM